MSLQTFPLLDEFFGFTTKEERNNFFRVRTPDQLARIWKIIAKDERLTISMILEMEQPYQAELCWRLVGNPQKMINRSGRFFTLEPTENAPEEGVLISNGTEDNERQFFRISNRQPVDAGLAINAMMKYGPTSPYKTNGKTLREVTAAELLAERNALASAAQPPVEEPEGVESVEDSKQSPEQSKRGRKRA